MEHPEDYRLAEMLTVNFNWVILEVAQPVPNWRALLERIRKCFETFMQWAKGRGVDAPDLLDLSLRVYSLWNEFCRYRQAVEATPAAGDLRRGGSPA